MGSSAGADGSNYVVIFRRVFFPASTVPQMYWEAGTTHPTTEFGERRTDNSSCQAARCRFLMGKAEMSTAGGALLAAPSVLSHGPKWVRCHLLPHQGAHLPQQHPIQTPRCTQMLPVRVVCTRKRWQILPGNPKTPAHVQAANNMALKHTWDISSLPAFWDLGLAAFVWGELQGSQELNGKCWGF